MTKKTTGKKIATSRGIMTLTPALAWGMSFEKVFGNALRKPTEATDEKMDAVWDGYRELLGRTYEEEEQWWLELWLNDYESHEHERLRLFNAMFICQSSLHGPVRIDFTP